jgi:hypothetical protein
VGKNVKLIFILDMDRVKQTPGVKHIVYGNLKISLYGPYKLRNETEDQSSPDKSNFRKP